MISKRDWVFTVERVESGQRRKYGDSYYHFIIESKRSIREIEKFCTEILSPAIPRKQYKAEQLDHINNHFRDYYTDLETDFKADPFSEELNRVVYKVVSPSTH